MTINKRLGDTIAFTALFQSSGVLTVPSSATMTITYPPSSNSLTTSSCAIAMAASGNYFTATWASSVAAFGLSSYTASAPGLVAGSSGSTGTLRLIS